MANIKPSEISSILQMQLQNMSNKVQFEEIGKVLQVSDGVAHVYGLDKVQSNELVEFENGTMGVVLNLEEDNVGVVLLGPTEGIKEGETVKRTQRIASVMAGEGMLGRVVDGLGRPIDGKGPIQGKTYEMPLERKAPGVIFRQPVNQPLQTGLKAIDAMIPIGRGQRELIIGDRQTGKTAIAIDTIINQKDNFKNGDPIYCIYVAVGQNMVLWTIPSWSAQRPPTLPPCSSTRHTRAWPSPNTSATQAVTLWLSTTISRSRPWPTVKSP